MHTYANKISSYLFDAHKEKYVGCLGTVSSSNLFLVSKPGDASFVGLRLKQLLSAKTVEQPTGHVVAWRGSCVIFFVCVCVAVRATSYLVKADDWLVDWLIAWLIAFPCLALPCLAWGLWWYWWIHVYIIYIYTSSWNRDMSSTLWTVVQQDARLNADAKVLGEIGVHYIWMNSQSRW